MKAPSTGNCNTRGFSTLEILIAFAILILSMSSVIMLVFGNQSVSVDTQTNNEALYKAQSMLETARALSRQDFSSVASIAAVADGIYQKSLDVVVDPNDPNVKQVTSTLSWTTAGRNLFVHLSTILTNPISGNICNPNPLGDWLHPRHYDFASYNMISPATGNNSNGLSIADIKAYRGKLYVAALTTANNGFTFYVFNTPTDATNMPIYVSGVDNSTSASAGLSAITLASQANRLYAYASSANQANFATCVQGSACAQLQTIDITDPANPTFVANYKIPSVTGKNGQSIGQSIFYDNNYVYLGLAKTLSGPEFNIIDVHDPLNPIRVGSYTLGRTVHSVTVSGNYAYITYDDNANGNKQFSVLDISNKVAPTLVGYFSAPGVGYGYAVALNANKAYFGRSWAGATSPNLYILDDINPAVGALPVLGSKVIGTSPNPDSVNAISVRDTLAFVLTNTLFQIFDVSQSSNIQPYASLDLSDFVSQGGNTQSGSTASLCAGNYFYVAVQTNGNNKDILSIVLPGAVNPGIALAVHDASHSTITTANAGDTVHAAATLTPTNSLAVPTGSMSFTFYPNAVCTSGTGAGAGSTSLVGGVADPSTLQGPLAAGSYSFKGHYIGDMNYNAIDSSCMPLIVNKITPTVTTQIHDSAHAVVTTVPAGTTVHDSVTVGGGALTPTGNVTLKWFTNATCANSPAATSPAQTLVGGAIDATAFLEGPLSVGSYSFLASYAGDTNYQAGTGSCEALTVVKASPTIATTPNATGPVGTTLNDTAVLSGGSSPTGSVTFTLYPPSDPSCSLAPSYTSVDPSAPYATSPGFVSNVVGTWHWKASYAGDANNNATVGLCSDEPVVISKVSPTIVTEIHSSSEAIISSAPLGTTAHDKATVSGGYTPSGSVNFTFYTNASCSGSGSAAGTTGLVGGAAHPSISEGPLAAGSYSFKAHYNGDANNNALDAACEPLTINKATPSMTTSIFNSATGLAINPQTSVLHGTTVYDKATMTGIAGFVPTGNITFTFYTQKITCISTNQVSSVLLSAGSANSAPYVVQTNDKVSYLVAAYPGDANYNSSSAGACQGLTAN